MEETLVQLLGQEDPLGCHALLQVLIPPNATL